MLTHGDCHDFTLSVLKCKEVRKIYRDHPYGLNTLSYHIAVMFYITQHPHLLKIFPILTCIYLLFDTRKFKFI